MAKTKYIETPEIMWQHFENYVTKVKSSPFLVKGWVGKDGDQVFREKEKPLTLEGFECHLFDEGIISDLSHYFANLDGRYTEYVAICSRIRKTIKKDQIEGGMANVYNTSITQRLNGLVEKTDNKNDNTNRNVTVEVLKSDTPIASTEKDISLD